MRPTTLRKSDEVTQTGVLADDRFLAAPATIGRNPSQVGVLLWIVQGLLALMFLFAGGMKLVLPIVMLTQQTPLPGLFLRFIGVLEVLGGIGLILPGLLHVRPGLTPLAAAGLVIIMSGATGVTMAAGDVAPALVPVVVGLLLASVAYGRWRVAPHRARRSGRVAGELRRVAALVYRSVEKAA